MYHWKTIYYARAALVILTVTSLFAGCARLRIPQIDPTGNRIFLPSPNSTSILSPNITNNSNPNPRLGGLPVQPSFVRPTTPSPCCGPNVNPTDRRRHVIPRPKVYPTRGETGEIIMSPSKIIAPVGSEVVVTAGLCGGDSFFVVNQPLEWLLSADSAGQIIEVGGTEHPTFNRLVRPTSKKFDGNYAWGRTGLKYKLLTRGTPTPVDDIELEKGQAYISLSSESQGTSYLTCVAPQAQAWDKRRKSTIIHWIDALWSIPVPKTATAGTVTPLTTLVRRNTDNGGVDGWKVKYTIVGGAPAEFAPTGSQSVEALTNETGQATVQLRQLAGQFDPGTTQIRVDVVRPRVFGESELIVESGITSVTWSAPALSIRAIGPKAAGLNEAFNYRVEVTNPGDQVSRDVVLRTKDLPDSLEFVSSNPKPTVFGRQLEWKLGDIQPGSPAKVIEIQLKSDTRGNNELCFEVSSQSDQLKTEACAQTEISVPCLGLQIDGPDSGKVGDQARFNIVIANQCDENLENVELRIQYDNGLATGLGNPIRTEIRLLGPDEKRTIPIVFDIVSAGRHCYSLSVTADGGHSARANECIEASPSTASSIELELEGSRRVDRGSNVLIRARITNNGNVPLNNLKLNSRFSDSLEPTRVTEEFPHRWLGDSTNELLFELDRLDPSQSKVVEVFYNALVEDGDAFSEVTVSSPDLSPITRRYDLRIEIPGTLGDPGTGDGGDDPGGDDPGGVAPQDPTPENPIQIPDDDRAGQLNAQRNLELIANVPVKQIPIGANGEIEFTISNSSTVSDRNVAMSFLLPTSLQLVDVLDDQGNRYPLVGRSNDFTRFDLEARNEMRPGGSFVFKVIAQAIQAGQATVELQVSSDNSAGTITTSDSLFITQ